MYLIFRIVTFSNAHSSIIYRPGRFGGVIIRIFTLRGNPLPNLTKNKITKATVKIRRSPSRHQTDQVYKLYSMH